MGSGNGSQDAAGTRTQRGPRSRSGCYTCRARHVKCDERPNGCINCERLSLPCSDLGDLSVVPTKSQKRTFRSCNACRASKAKCSGNKPSCSRCQRKRLRCIYGAESEPAWIKNLNESGHAASQYEPSDHVVDGRPRSHPSRASALVDEAHSSESPSPAEAISQSQLPPWLISSSLPSPNSVRMLVDRYFVNVHPLRCFAFLHKPTFLRKLEADLASRSANSPMLYIICALGAQFYALELEPLPPVRSILRAGKQWAQHAQQLILGEIDRISIENLMAAVLLHDYALRLGNFTTAFMLCGIMSRMSQALQINLEYSTDVLCEDTSSGPSVTVRESRRRLMWSCWAADALVGSGVDSLTILDEKDLKIQLPCNDRSFLHQIPSITETLEDGHVLSFIDPEFPRRDTSGNIGIAAQFLRHIRTRRRVLNYIKRLHLAEPPWLAESEFRALDLECRTWYDSLPATLKFTGNAIYIRKESSQLGALCLLHCAYHQTMCDLFRLGAPALYKLRGAFNFPPEQRDFLRHLQRELLRHAMSLATITYETGQHGARMLADTWLPTIIYDSSRIMLYHLTQLIDRAVEDPRLVLQEVTPLLRQNIETLKLMQPLHVVARPLTTAAERMLEKASDPKVFHTTIAPESGAVAHADEESPPGTPAQAAPDYVLNPLTIFRMARDSIKEKHAPEKVAYSPSNTAGSVAYSSVGSPRSPRSQRQPPDQDVQVAHPVTASITTTQNVDDQANFGATYPQLERMDSELQDLFTSELGWTWQTADTMIGSASEIATYGSLGGTIGNDGVLGLLPWAPNQFQTGFDASSYADRFSDTGASFRDF